VSQPPDLRVQRRVSNNSRPSFPESKIRRVPNNPSGEAEIQQKKLPKRVKILNSQKEEESPYMKMNRRAREAGSESDEPSPFLRSSEVEALQMGRPVKVNIEQIAIEAERPSGGLPKSSKNMRQPKQLSGTASSSFGMTPNTNPQLLKAGYQNSAEMTGPRREMIPIDSTDPVILQSILTPDNIMQFTD